MKAVQGDMVACHAFLCSPVRSCGASAILQFSAWDRNP